ncbi:MAG TPA: FtsQ-type POTRA domain-containing protein [Streptosporangiaceae bacterium]
MTGSGPGDHGAPPASRPPRPGDGRAPVSVAETGPSGPDQAEGGHPEGGRPPQESLARAHSPWRTAFIAVAVVGLVVGIGWALLGSKLLVVRSIVVNGNHLVPASQVRTAAGISPKLPMIRVDTQAVAHRVEGITQVKSATVTKSWPDRIVITVKERTPALAVRVQGTSKFDLIDQAGVVVRSVSTQPAGMPVFQATVAPDSLRGNPGVAAAVAVLHELPASLAKSVAAVAAPGARSVKLGLSNGITIEWGGTGEAKQKTAELAILMRTHARYYDVSAPGTAVTR